LARTTSSPAIFAEEARDQLHAVNAALPVFGTTTLDETVSASVAVRRFSAELLALFALTALVLASLGLYGGISYLVNERTHEIGVRMALGASRADVTRLVLRQGMSLTAVGVGLGLVGAAAAGRAMAGALYGVSPTDPLTFGVVTSMLAAVALAACYLPARR